jgi:hypothetical protein
MGAMVKIDASSPEWQAIQQWAKGRKAQEMEALMSPQLEHSVTQVVRGRLSILDELINLPTAQTVMQDVQPGY